MSDHLAEAPDRRARKNIHWFRFFYAVWLEDCRKAQLSPEETGVYIEFICLMWIDQARIVDDVATIARRLGFDIRQVKRILAQLVGKGLLVRAAGTIWNPRAERDLAQLRDSYRVAKKDLSRKPRKNNETDPTDLELRLRTSSVAPPEPDAAAVSFERFWSIWPESQWKRSKAECLGLYRTALAQITPAEIEAAALAHAAKNPGQFAGAPKKWLTTGGWQDYAATCSDDPDASNLPLWDDADKIRARDAKGHFPVWEWVLNRARAGGGWHPELGHSLTSGERTALHDYIVSYPGLIDRLEHECGTEIPGWMRDAADMAAADKIVPFVPRAAVVDVRVSA